MIVVDANVVVHLIVPGQMTAAAERVLADDANWRVPALWLSEVRSALVQHVRAKHLARDDASTALILAESLLDGAEVHVDSRRVLELAFASNASAYDCEYIAAAQSLGTRLVTADVTLARAFPETAVLLEA